MKKSLYLLGICLCLGATVAHAQNGCINSPENPTVILGLVGGAGACLASLRNRLRHKR